MKYILLIQRIERHLKKAEELIKMDLADDMVFNSLAMECFQAVNSAIELGQIIATDKHLEFPSSYTNIFEILAGAKLIDRRTEKNMKRLIYLRNLISHEYYRITQDELKEMADLLDTLEVLIKYIKSYKK